MAHTFVRLLWHCIWFAQAGLHFVLAWLLIHRKFFRLLPVFVVYVIWVASLSAILLWMNYSPFVSGSLYWAVYSLEVTGSTALRFAILYELFRRVLSGYPTLHKSGFDLLRWSIIFLIAVAIVLAWLAPAGGAGRLMAMVYALERTANVLLCGLMIFLFVLASYFRLSWRSHVFGIALGFGVMAACSLGIYAIRSQIEPLARNVSTDVLDLMTQGATLCSVLIWIGYVLAPERKPPAVRRLPDHNLETWNQELERLLHL